MTADTLPAGTTLGAYEILGFIAAGGMGSVYRAKNRILGDLRAIKVILPSLSSNPEFVNRFVREAQLAARLQHPNVVKMLEPAMEGSTMFLPMELLEGESLSDLAKREAPLAPQMAIDLMLPICAGVQALHQAGIIHRDLKPANIFLARSPDGNVVPKILDFGAARATESDGDQTSTGSVIGSAHYMPIEQAVGRKDIDSRVDVYALGVIAYLLLTRKRPYENDDTGMAMAKIIQGLPYTSPQELSPWLPAPLAEIVMRAMAHDRSQRYQTVEAFAIDLMAARQLTDGIVMPPKVRQRHTTHSSVITQPSFIGNTGRPRAMGLGGDFPSAVEPSGSAVSNGMTTGVSLVKSPASKLPLIGGAAIGLFLLGAVAMVAFRSGQSTSNDPVVHAVSPQAQVDASASTTPAQVAQPTLPVEQPTQTAEDAAVAQVLAEDAAPTAATAHTTHGHTASGHTSQNRGNRTPPVERPQRCVPRLGIPCL
ncbi:MAG: serine/threonine-protein kinase [Deltaproteobacteria bacterium]|nr:serine/threonine-protein kinase [Deltaproteobacteria bacterium]